MMRPSVLAAVLFAALCLRLAWNEWIAHRCRVHKHRWQFTAYGVCCRRCGLRLMED